MRFVVESWLNVLLIFVPVSAFMKLMHADPTWIFFVSALGIIPLAGMLGTATEQLTARVGVGLGGLLNASLGNAAELIIALAALREGLHVVVKASLTGSILGNILLVLGASMLAGGSVMSDRNSIERPPAQGRVSCCCPRWVWWSRHCFISPPPSEA